MTGWGFEPRLDVDDELPEAVFGALSSLQAVAQTVVPDVPIERREHRTHELDREIRTLLGDRSMPFFENSDQIHAYADLLNRVLGEAGSMGGTSAREPRPARAER